MVEGESGRYTVVRNSPRIASKFYLLAGLMALIELMVWFFLGMMSMDDSVDWTGELIFYVALCLVIPVVSGAVAVLGAKMQTDSRVYFDGERVIVDRKFCRARELAWSDMGGMLRTGGMGFVLLDGAGKKFFAADHTMENYNDFYDMAIRKCRDYKREREKESTGTYGQGGGALRVDLGFGVLAFVLGMGISDVAVAALVQLGKSSPGISDFLESLPAWGFALLLSALPAAGLIVVLALRARHCWKYSDSGLELSFVFGKRAELGWGQIRRAEVESTRSAAGESLAFTLHTVAEKYESGKFLTKGSRDFLLQLERMAERYGFEIKRW